MSAIISSHMRSSILAGLTLYALLVLTTLLYWPGLDGPLLLDDFENLNSLADLSKGITTWRDVLTTSSSSILGRPLAMLSFIANQIASAGEVWAFKYTNLMIHLLCGVLVFWLCGRLLREHLLASYRWPVALWVTALWLLTPLQVSTVLYVVQRMAQLATLFTLAGLITYVIGRQNIEYRPKLSIALILSCFLLWWPIAILSKENGALLPLLTFVIEIFFFRFCVPVTRKRILVGLYVLLLLIPAILLIAKIILDPTFILNGYTTRDFTLTERLLSQSRILFDYLRTLLIPYGPGLGLYHDDFAKSTGFLIPITTLMSILAWALIVMMAVISLIVQSRISKTISYVFFGFLFFLSAHALESSVFPLELYFEHRNYLPALGIYFSLSIAFFSLIQKLQQRKFLFILLSLLPLAHAAASYPRVQTWKTWEQILFSSAQAHPQSSRVHGDLAIYYSTHGNPDQAFFHLDEAAKWNPQLKTAAAIMRIGIYCQNGLTVNPIEYENLKSRLSFVGGTSTKNIFNLLASLLQNKPCPQLDIVKFGDIIEQWLTRQPSREHEDTIWFIRIMLGKMFFYSNQIIEAINQMGQAIKIYPERLEAGLIKFQYQMMLGDIENAQRTLAALKRHDTGSRIDLSRAILDFDKQLQELKRTAKP